VGVETNIREILLVNVIMCVQLSIALIVQFAVGVTSAANPGFKTEITQTGLDYVRQVGIPILISELQNLNIPDQSGSTGSPIGDIDYDLTRHSSDDAITRIK
jgi:hypothetical protein